MPNDKNEPTFSDADMRKALRAHPDFRAETNDDGTVTLFNVPAEAAGRIEQTFRRFAAQRFRNGNTNAGKGNVAKAAKARKEMTALLAVAAFHHTELKDAVQKAAIKKAAKAKPATKPAASDDA